jgi:ABC-type Fe3+-hydroxamate transport system substrate-binding protein
MIRLTQTRVASLVPSVTETLLLFGITPVARTKFCVEPRGKVRRIPVVGGVRNPDLARLRALKPDLVIADRDENRREDVDWLRRHGIRVWVTHPRTVRGAVKLLEEIRKLAADGRPALKWLRRVKDALRRGRRRKRGRRPAVVVLVWKNPWVAVGGRRYIGDLIRMAGGRNPAAKYPERYPKLSESRILSLRPDILLLPTEPYRFGWRDARDWRARFRKSGLRARVRRVKGEDLCWPGVRLVKGLAELQRLIRTSE